MIRMSVTDLDLYRGYLADEDADLDKLLRDLRRQTPPTDYMRRGKAFHSILERAHVGEVSLAEEDGFTFRFDLDNSIVLPEVRELKGELQILTRSGPVTLVGKVDGYDLAVHDFKLTGYFDAEKYLNAYQWRCYLLMFGAWKFVYDVFTYREDPRTGEIVINDYHVLPLYAYPELQTDVLGSVEEFAGFIQQHLPEKVLAEAA